MYCNRQIGKTKTSDFRVMMDLPFEIYMQNYY